MCTEDVKRVDLVAEAFGADAVGTPLERLATALGYSAAIFTDGAAVEPRLSETAELLRLWVQVRDPAATRRILSFVAAIVAEQA